MRTAELRREALQRKVVLFAVSQYAPYPVTDRAVLVDMQIRYPELDCGVLLAQRICDYLAGHGLCEAETKDKCWAAKITAKGTDYLAGVGETLEGVARG
jgi:hypothetical protein